MALPSDLTTINSDELITKAAEMRPASASSGPEPQVTMSDTIMREASNPAKRVETSAMRIDDIPFEVTKARARKIADLTSDREYEALQNQHRILTRKSFEAGISKDEELQLHLVHWMLDCVETSRVGIELDSLEQIARSQEIIADNITRTAEDLSAIIAEQRGKSRYRKSA